MRTVRSARLAVVAVCTALLLSACGGDSVEDDLAASPPPETSVDDSPDPSPTPTQQETADASPSPSPSPSPEPEPEPEPTQETAEPEPAGPCEDRDQRDFTTSAFNFGYTTTSITDVCSGDTVTLTIDEGSHSFTVVGAEGDTGVFGSGSETTTVSGDPGTHQFRCSLHPNQMSGQIEIIG